MNPLPQSELSLCAQCGTALGRAMLACPQCGRLTYSDALKQMAAEAAEAEAAGNRPQAAQIWRAMLTLLPPGAGQRAAIEQTISRLEQAQATGGGAGEQEAIERKSQSWKKWLGVAAPVVALLATKGKFLFLGLTKLPTLLSMLVFLSAYWDTWGWAFALGFVLSIYVHEMGHVIMLKHYGIAATAPLFIPGFGAIIFSRQRIVSAAQDAHVGLAGPLAGLAAALVCLALYPATGNKLFLALTVFGAYINLLNLVPLLFLDGARGLRGLGETQRWAVAGVAIVCAIVFSSKLSLGVAAVIAGRLLFWAPDREEASQPGDIVSFALFAALLIALAGLTTIDAPSPEQLRKPIVTTACAALLNS